MGKLSFWSNGADADDNLPPMLLTLTPDASEDFTFTANGPTWGGRLTYLYVYRYGGLKAMPQ